MPGGELYNEDPVTGDARLCGTTASLCGLEGGNSEKAIRLDLMLHAMMLFQSGIPVLYSGDEIGQKNDWDYKNDPNKVQDSRYLHRGKMPWNLTENIEKPETHEAQIFHGLTKLETLRREHKAFFTDADFWTFDTGSDQVLGLGRWYDGEGLIALFHFGEQDGLVTLPEGTFVDILTGERYEQESLISAGDFRWLRALE